MTSPASDRVFGVLGDTGDTFATHLSLKGVRIKVVQELLGHADIKTTRVYLHTSYADLQRGLNQYILSTLQQDMVKDSAEYSDE
ncbi:MAG: tyrosine-type recombinase/integrase [Chloroflexota bacterium]